MEQDELHQILDKYLRGVATEAETQLLMQWYRSQLNDDVQWEVTDAAEESKIKHRIAYKIEHTKGQPVPVLNQKQTNRRWGWASVAMLAAGIAGALFWFNRTELIGRIISTNEVFVNAEPSVEENRFVLLPDSSKVILRPGSSLEYKSDFNGKTREVALIGEGYFDIRRDESRPFIVHAGEVKTRVLGTAFTIKALQGETDVQVTVEHGKVRVEKQNKVLAELIANQQLAVDNEKDVMAQKVVQAVESSLWTASDLHFDNKPFGELMESLERRYAVEIIFKNPAVANCLITGSFRGTETLEEVLTTICPVRNARFKRLENGTIEIDGKGCPSN